MRKNTSIGGQLIFIISQPRSGSTLLQHVLGSHSEVHTLPEPWLMLHLAYGLRPSGLQAEYNAQMAYHATRDFLQRISGGEAIYVEAIRKMAVFLYEKARESSGKRYFLDKTPRYYFIIPELYRIFPKAKFVLLLRNPLAVLSSILHVSLGGNWRGLAEMDKRHDLLSAPRLILEGIGQLGEQGVVVHYEELVTQPDETVRTLCHCVGLEFEPNMLSYGDRIRFEGTPFLDSKSIYEHQGPVADYVDEWFTTFDTRQKIHIAKAYLATLGENTVGNLGYSYGDLMSKLDSLRSNKKQCIVPWEQLVTPVTELSWWARVRLGLVTSLHNHGLWGTLRRYASYVLRGH